MSDLDDKDIRRALGPDSKATFGDLRRKLEADRPGACDRFAAEVTALATGAREPEAERHAAECARCRDLADQAGDVWRRLAWPASRARFDDLKPRLLAPLPLRMGRAVAAALLAASVIGAVAWPSTFEDGDKGARLEREGLGVREIAALGTVRAAKTLIAIGGAEAEAALVAMMGRNRDVDEVIANALAGSNVGPMHPAELVRERRPDLLPALIDAAPPGSALTIVPALFDPRLAGPATRALERLPHDEVATALELSGLSATPEEGAAFAERGVAISGALAAASRSRDHRMRCFWSAVGGADGLDFLFAAAGSAPLREDALMFLGLLPDDTVFQACREALRDPELAAGAARAAAKLGDRRLVPALMRAASHPPQGMGSAGFEIVDGSLVTARSETLESVCLEAVTSLTRN
jgi:hypothetical protein